MIVSELLNTYKAESNYVVNSMLNKSFDDYGAVYKWLCKKNQGGYRREIFIATSGTGALESRTVIEAVEVLKADV